MRVAADKSETVAGGTACSVSPPDTRGCPRLDNNGVARPPPARRESATGGVTDKSASVASGTSPSFPALPKFTSGEVMSGSVSAGSGPACSSTRGRRVSAKLAGSRSTPFAKGAGLAAVKAGASPTVETERMSIGAPSVRTVFAPDTSANGSFRLEPASWETDAFSSAGDASKDPCGDNDTTGTMARRSTGGCKTMAMLAASGGAEFVAGPRLPFHRIGRIGGGSGGSVGPGSSWMVGGGEWSSMSEEGSFEDWSDKTSSKAV